MKNIIYLSASLILISLCSCASLAVFAGEKLGRIGKPSIGTTRNFKVAIAVKTQEGIQKKSRIITRKITGYGASAGSVRPNYETVITPKGEEFIFYSKNNKLIITVPYATDLGKSEYLYQGIKKGRLYEGSKSMRWLDFNELNKPESFSEYGFQLLYYKAPLVE